MIEAAKMCRMMAAVQKAQVNGGQYPYWSSALTPTSIRPDATWWHRGPLGAPLATHGYLVAPSRGTLRAVW